MHLRVTEDRCFIYCSQSSMKSIKGNDSTTSPSWPLIVTWLPKGVGSSIDWILVFD